jgi:hypothetical protein
MDLDTILTIYNADHAQKELIRALACEALNWRDRCRTVERELESAQMALESMTAAHDMLLEDNAKLFAQVTVLEQTTVPATVGLDEQLRFAAERGQYVRAKTADGLTHKGVPEWDVSYWPHLPAGVNEHWIGEAVTNDDTTRVVSVEVI